MNIIEDEYLTEEDIKIEDDVLNDDLQERAMPKKRFIRRKSHKSIKKDEHKPPTDHAEKSWKEYLKLENSLQTHYCPHCAFETKWKCYMKNHIKKIHTSAEDSRMYRCKQCKFQTKWKFSLSNHMKVHCAPGAVKMHKCPHCNYATKWNNGLTSHLKVHMLPKVMKLTIYKCEECSYECKNKLDLGHHVKMCHGSDDTIYKCPLCNFETKHRHGVNKHVKVHNAARMNGVQ